MDLPLTQVKPREIGVFVNNLKRLLIKWKENGLICQPSNGRGLEKMCVFFKI